MEMLKILEQKIVALASIIKELKVENVKIVEENKKLETDKKHLHNEIAQLSAELEEIQVKMRVLENSILKDHERSSKDQEDTKAVVDELIKSIDFLVGESQQ
jgi:uncharacterized protein YaaN involved in tellurite resistance